jgi:hypothetical protein
MFNYALASSLNADHAGRVTPEKGRHRGRLGVRTKPRLIKRAARLLQTYEKMFRNAIAS